MAFGNNAVTLEKFSLLLFGAVLFLFVCVYSVRPITDSDFWWHLSTGKQMALDGGLLQEDPFSFGNKAASLNATDEEGKLFLSDETATSFREKATLKGYWLWQVVAYQLYNHLGYSGIFLMSFVLLSSCLALLIWQFVRDKTSPVIYIPLLALGMTVFSAEYFMERPHVISFLFALILVQLLTKVRRDERLGWSLPAVMIVWANSHGGYIVGNIVLVLFMAGAVVQFRNDTVRRNNVLLWSSLGIAASLVNPVGWEIVPLLLKFYDSSLMKTFQDYQSTFWGFVYNSKWLAIVWVLTALQLYGLVKSKKIYWPELLVILFLYYFAIMHTRNIGFVAVALLPWNGWYLQKAVGQKMPSRQLLAGALIVAILLLGGRGWAVWRERDGGWPVLNFYPDKAVTFIKTTGLHGQIFSSLTWGGYLIWELYPDSKIFMDGRTIILRKYSDYMEIMEGLQTVSHGRKRYEYLLDYYNVDTVVESFYRKGGRISPLLKLLLNDRQWHPVYLDENNYVIKRSGGSNGTAIKQYAIDKKIFIERILKQLDLICMMRPTDVLSHVARAELLMYYGRYEDARNQLDYLERISPQIKEIGPLLKQLQGLEGK